MSDPTSIRSMMRSRADGTLNLAWQHEAFMKSAFQKVQANKEGQDYFNAARVIDPVTGRVSYNPASSDMYPDGVPQRIIAAALQAQNASTARNIDVHNDVLYGYKHHTDQDGEPIPRYGRYMAGSANENVALRAGDEVKGMSPAEAGVLYSKLSREFPVTGVIDPLYDGGTFWSSPTRYFRDAVGRGQVREDDPVINAAREHVDLSRFKGPGQAPYADRNINVKRRDTAYDILSDTLERAGVSRTHPHYYEAVRDLADLFSKYGQKPVTEGSGNDQDQGAAGSAQTPSAPSPAAKPAPKKGGEE